MVIQKDAFWKAAIITLVVFLLGVFLGYMLESKRINDLNEEYKEIEVEWADAKLQSIYYQNLDPFYCNAAIKENLRFADRVYREGLKLERYENANKLTKEILYEKKRYALFKVEFWINSIYLKEKCDGKYSNIVYFYKDKANINERSEQGVQSHILKEIKDIYGNQIMLIPLAIDLNITVVNIMKETYNITEVPTILVDEKIKFEGITNLTQIERIIDF